MPEPKPVLPAPLEAFRLPGSGTDASSGGDIDAQKYDADGPLATALSSQSGGSSHPAPSAHGGGCAGWDPSSQSGGDAAEAPGGEDTDAKLSAVARAALLRSRIAKATKKAGLTKSLSDCDWVQLKAESPHVAKEIRDNGKKRRRNIARTKQKEHQREAKDASAALRFAQLVARPKNAARQRQIDMDDL